MIDGLVSTAEAQYPPANHGPWPLTSFRHSTRHGRMNPFRVIRTDALVAMVIAAFTAFPISLRIPDTTLLVSAMQSDFSLIDTVANILGYVPFGLATARRGALPALIFGGALSLFAESMQLFYAGRDPNIEDLVANFAGTAVGILIARNWRPLPTMLPISSRVALVAGALAIAYLASGATFTIENVLLQIDTRLRTIPWTQTNPRGYSLPGKPEGHWSFDSLNRGRFTSDTRTGPDAVPVGGPVLQVGAVGNAIALKRQQWVDLGRGALLQFEGSLTVSAWIRPDAFSADDAPIVSSFDDEDLGFQLDLTPDTGKRTIGFKLAGSEGRMMVRYGGTAINAAQWHHVAGVYDAQARTLDVYLDGRLDNSCLLGTITSRQVPSGSPVLIGHRMGPAEYGFTGSIDEVDIQSSALAGLEVAALAGHDPPGLTPQPSDRREISNLFIGAPSCDFPPSETAQPHAGVAGGLVSLGILIAVAFSGLWRGPAFRGCALAASLTAGVTVAFLLPASSSSMALLVPIFLVLSGSVATLGMVGKWV